MQTRNLNGERRRLEEALKSGCHDFTGTYMALQDLHAVVRRHADIVTSETISVLQRVLQNARFSRQTQSFFLYREAADVLASIVTSSTVDGLAEKTASALTYLLGTLTGTAKRASAEALGSLPLVIHSPAINEYQVTHVPRMRWQDILERQGIRDYDSPSAMGRSLVVRADNAGRLLVLKLASDEESIESIHREALWMEHLCSERYSFPMRFDIPMPIRFNGGYVFRLEATPEEANVPAFSHAISFIAHKDYFVYPNDRRQENRLDLDRFREVMLRNAWLSGKLTSLGIVHSALIPLFHNRVQRHRRADGGLYEWQRGGRLDRWLESCSYPNFGLTGIRDFEHLASFNGKGRRLYYQIGAHVLSLLLVTGSYFRNEDAQKVGLDRHGCPVDARHLFEKQAFKELVRDIFLSYYHGFVGRDFVGDMPCDLDALVSRMIEEMGVDRHMEEVLRVVDQREMTDDEFRRFLVDRGYDEAAVQDVRKGEQDITLHTGPHLGGFNERISLPELIECVSVVSALCVAGRYLEQRVCGHASSASSTCPA